MTIQNLRIQTVRGISDFTINQAINKNRPYILVAPNGFGKTSIAKAFKSAADQTSIKLKDTDRYFHDDSKPASLALEFDNGQSIYTKAVTEKAHTNDIRKEFDIFVISDLREVTASANKIGSFSTKPKGKLIIPSIKICPIIKKPENPYKISEIKESFGDRYRLLQNLNSTLFAQDMFKENAREFCIFIDRLVMPRLWKRIDSIRDNINSYRGSEEDFIQTASDWV
jgi:energy-coupling factor transporter ATP-binding protein EcfA2